MNNQLINFFLLPVYKSIIFLYEKGDLFIIPVKFVDSNTFKDQWMKIISSLEKNSDYNLNGIIKGSIKNVIQSYIHLLN